MPSRRVLALVLAGLLARLLIIWSGWAEGPLIADDAYYYFKIAANLAAGLGPTFDGLAPTNGFHPLWLWTLVPVFALAGDQLWLPVKLALTLASLCDLATGLLILAILRALGAGARAWLAALFWFLSPLTVLVGLRGMEASLSALLVVLVFWRLTALALAPRPPGPGQAVATGLLIGLAGLARVDNLAVLGLATVVFLAALGRSPSRWLRPACWRWLSVVTVAAGTTVLPWFWWNLASFGSLVPVSGQVKTHFAIYGSLDTDWHSLRSVARFLTDATVAPLFHAARFACVEEFATARFTHAVTLGLVAAVGVPWWRGRRELSRRYRATPAGAVLWATAAFLAGHVILMSVVWRAYINWYALPSLALFALVLGVVTAPAGRSWRRTVPVIVAVACGLLLYGRFFTRLDGGPALGERQNRARLTALAAAYPGGVRAGAFNAGLVGYVAPRFGDITVINLDGRVNNAAFAAAREGRLSRYMLDQVAVLLEKPGTGYLYYRPGELDTLALRYERWPGWELWFRDGLPAAASVR
jgi:hypothetical protein